MRTESIRLDTGWIKTESLEVCWYSNGQMWWYMEVKDGKLHGEFKRWNNGGEMYWHEVYENNERVKRIV